jgi:ATP-dependent Clp protease protease subunit
MADTIQGLKSPVHTICRGEAGGAAVLLLASGRHGLRHAARSCSVRVAAQSGPGALPGSGKARREIVARLSLLSGQPVSSIEDAIARREVMSAERAHAYGLVDDVLSDANAR